MPTLNVEATASEKSYAAAIRSDLATEQRNSMFATSQTRAERLESMVRAELRKRRRPDWSNERAIREAHKIRRMLLGRHETKPEREARLEAEKAERRYSRRVTHSKRQALSNKHAKYRSPNSPRYADTERMQIEGLGVARDGRGKDPIGTRDRAEMRMARKIDGVPVKDRPFRVRGKRFDARFKSPTDAAIFAAEIWRKYGETPYIVHNGRKRWSRKVRDLGDLLPWMERFNVTTEGTILAYITR